MNSCGIQSNRDEMRRSSVVVSDRSVLVCPKPRRVGALNHLSSRSLRWQVSHQMELSDLNSRSEILDFILAKSGGGGCEQDQARSVMSSSPPVFFSGSPPSRVSNPLTKDSLFREELLLAAPSPPMTPLATKPQPPPSPRNGGGCVRATANFGNNPAVRVVGFNCLDRDRRSSVSTVA